MVVGVFPAIPILYAWMTNNSEPHYRRATSVAIIVVGINSVCFDDDKYNLFFFLIMSYPPGWNFEYLEFPI